MLNFTDLVELLFGKLESMTSKRSAVLLIIHCYALLIMDYIKKEVIRANMDALEVINFILQQTYY